MSDAIHRNPVANSTGSALLPNTAAYFPLAHAHLIETQNIARVLPSFSPLSTTPSQQNTPTKISQENLAAASCRRILHLNEDKTWTVEEIPAAHHELLVTAENPIDIPASTRLACTPQKYDLIKTGCGMTARDVETTWKLTQQQDSNLELVQLLTASAGKPIEANLVSPNFSDSIKIKKTDLNPSIRCTLQVNGRSVILEGLWQEAESSTGTPQKGLQLSKFGRLALAEQPNQWVLVRIENNQIRHFFSKEGTTWKSKNSYVTLPAFTVVREEKATPQKRRSDPYPTHEADPIPKHEDRSAKRSASFDALIAAAESLL